MSTEPERIKEQLKQLRSDNRAISAENRRVRGEIEKVKFASKELLDERNSHEKAFQAKVQACIKNAELEAQHHNHDRAERRKWIMSEIRKQSAENKGLTGEVHALEAEIERIRQIYEAYPSRYPRLATA
jgi:chromosome segregation ATPase